MKFAFSSTVKWRKVSREWWKSRMSARRFSITNGNRNRTRNRSTSSIRKRSDFISIIAQVNILRSIVSHWSIVEPVFTRYEIPLYSHGSSFFRSRSSLQFSFDWTVHWAFLLAFLDSILPGDTLKLSFVFKSRDPGIFTERWQLLTRPVLCGGRPIIFTLRGVTNEEDVHRDTRLEIEVRRKDRRTDTDASNSSF